VILARHINHGGDSNGIVFAAVLVKNGTQSVELLNPASGGT
jgi:hypothetical protein